MNNIKFISTELRLDGNHLCFDFINTVYDRRAEELRDLILSQEDWMAWLSRANLINNEIGPNNFDLKQILDLRELLYNIFTVLVKKEAPNPKGMRKFEKWVLKMNQSMHFSFENGMMTERLKMSTSDKNVYLLLIVKSAKELMLSKKLNRCKECQNCGWLYLDTSKNNSRRWCSMDTCGSQIKAKRYYQNKKKAKVAND